MAVLLFLLDALKGLCMSGPAAQCKALRSATMQDSDSAKCRGLHGKAP